MPGTAHSRAQRAPSDPSSPAPGAPSLPPLGARLLFPRISNSAAITPKKLKTLSRISGTVVKVGDADGLRLYHQPGGPVLGPKIHPVPDRKLRLAEETISVRLAGADAPELAHFGRPGQPFGPEAKQALSDLVLGQWVTVDVGRVDQYKRLVGTVYVWRAPYVQGPTNVSLALVKKGLATVYTQGGAEYGHASYWHLFTGSDSSGRKRLMAAQERAQAYKHGMWSQAHVTTPSEFKKAQKSSKGKKDA